MSPEFQHASFIPKRPLVHIPNQRNATRRSRKTNVFGIIASIVFGVGLLGAGGVYIYNDVLEEEIENQRQLLEQETARIKDRDLVDTFKTVHAQIILAEEVIKKHISPSAIFQVIGEVTVQSAQLTTVSVDGSPDAGTFSIALSGTVQSFESLVRQADVYRGDERIKQVELGDVEVSDDSSIGYEAELAMDATLGKYAKQFPSIDEAENTEVDAVPAENEIIETVEFPNVNLESGEPIDVPVIQESENNSSVPAGVVDTETETGLENFDSDFLDLEELLNEEF